MSDDPKPTSGDEVARLFAGTVREGVGVRMERAYEAHNAVTALVAMYGSIIQQLKTELDQERAQNLALWEQLRKLKGPP